jgi:diguanylate cyclase (GGDEF)-like protein/PAS domain S-box-containing protein
VRYDSGQLQNQVNNMGQTLAFTIQEDVNISEGVLASLAYNYEVDPDLSEEKFATLAKHYINLNPDIIYIQHKNKETVTDMVYPDTYDYTIGATLKGRPEVEEAVSKAIKNKVVTANAPFVLRDTDGLLGLVIRYPLYQEETFNGFFVVVMSVNNFINGIIDTDMTSEYNISFFDDKGNLFWGYDGPQKGHVYQNSIAILDNSWTINVAMKDNVKATTIGFVMASSVLYLLIVGLLVLMQIRLFKKDQNIQNLANLKKELEKVKESYSLALDSANDALWEWNIETGEIFTSDKWVDITGNEMEGQGLEAILQKESVHPDDYEHAVSAFEACLSGEQLTIDNTYRIMDPLGIYSWVQIRGKVYINGLGEPYIIAGSITNINERKQRESRMEYMAYFDSLTGLANKERFMDLLESELEKSGFTQKRCSILMLDLDNFKRYNDTLGLEFCDQLLKHIGEIISSIVGNDNLTARFGGDEFLILLRHTDTLIKVETVCKKLIDVFKIPFVLDFKTIHITASIGAVCCLRQNKSVSEYMRNADMALNKAKESGRNQYCFFDDDMHAEILRNAKIESCIREAIKRDTLMIHYQLQQNLSDEKIRGIEALARLSDDTLGVISPLEFIQIAEYTGLIIPLGNWILKNACMQGKAWLDAGYQIGKLSVNISAHQLFKAGLYDDVRDILTQTGFPVERLELEITESVLFNASIDSLDILKSLKSLGLKIALDDFGTGYSSLNYLTVMPIDTLKIDKSFVDKAYESERETQVIKSIIELAHNLNLHVVAEGVETLNQKEMLKQMDCNSIQGYYFARPLSAADVTKLL